LASTRSVSAGSSWRVWRNTSIGIGFVQIQLTAAQRLSNLAKHRQVVIAGGREPDVIEQGQCSRAT
jgi:hypothetical protein